MIKFCLHLFTTENLLQRFYSFQFSSAQRILIVFPHILQTHKIITWFVCLWLYCENISFDLRSFHSCVNANSLTNNFKPYTIWTTSLCLFTFLSMRDIFVPQSSNLLQTGLVRAQVWLKKSNYKNVNQETRHAKSCTYCFELQNWKRRKI